jgi:hypothetical protein
LQAPRRGIDKNARGVHLNNMLTVLNFTLHPKPTTEIAVVASPTSVGGELGAMFDVEVSESPA